MNRFRIRLSLLTVILLGFVLMVGRGLLWRDGVAVQSSDKPYEEPSLRVDRPSELKKSVAGTESSTKNVSEGRRVQLARQDNAKLKEVAKKRESQGVYRFAQGIGVHLTPNSAGQWSTIEGGLKRWTLEVDSPGALSLNIGFRRYRMPEGGRLTIYPRAEGRGGKGTRVFTEADNEEHGQLWTPLFPGSELIVEADLPAGKERELELELSQVNHGFRGFEKAMKAVGDSLQQGCELDVACSAETLPGLGTAIDFYRNQIKAVGAFTLGGVEVASGALINNAARDGRPFFLTAYHTGVDLQNAPSMVVYWNFQNSVCGGPNCCGNSDDGDGNLDQFNTGAIFRAGYSKSDVTLVELDDPLDPAYKLYYAGWDRSVDQATQSACVHHPGVSEKRISLSFNATTTTSWLGASAPGDGSHARVVWSNGITEPGSSGSPLFNQSGRIIGQLHGGDSKCDGTGADWYGRLSMSWEGGGTPATRLKDWLDPVNTGVMTFDGMHPLPFLSISDATIVEGNAGSQNLVFKVTLSPSVGQPVTVAYATIPDTATSPSDYSATSGSLTFQPGETQKSLTVQVQGDATPESDERFLVRLSGATGASIFQSDGVGFALNDDYTAPSIISPLSINVEVGRPIGYSIAAANTPRTFALGGTPPAGMSINSANGRIDWVPPVPGPYSVQIIASNPGGSDTKTLVINAAYRSVDLASGLPPVADQGILPSSAAWAVCYYYKSYQEAKEHGWSLTDPAHQFSPSFAINQYGTASLLLGDVLALLDDRGCAPISLVPYTEDDTSTWPKYDGCLAALPYRSNSHRALGGEGTPEIIERMRAHLDSGDLCVFQFPLFRSTLDSPGSFETMNAGNDRYQMPSSAEAVVTDYPALAVVGYDDSQFDGRGGFRVIGSFGPKWGRQGLAWVSYDFVQSFSFGVYTMEDRVGYTPAATARISASHSPSSTDDILTLTLGTGDEDQPRWSSDVLNALSLSADFAVDLTEAVSLLPPSPSRQWWLKAQNYDYGSGKTTIRRFEIQVGPSSYSAEGDLPVFNSGDGVRSTRALRCVLPAGPAQYYVNDASLVGDQYSSAVGNDNNDGLTPATPKASLQALIQTYHLRGGDTVWIDVGTYTTPSAFSETDSGRSATPLVIRGALLTNGEPGSIFDLSGVTTTSVVTFANGAGNVRLEKLWLKGGLNNVSQNDSSYRDHSLSFSQVRFSGSSQEACNVYGGSRSDFMMDHCVVAGAKLRLRGCDAVLRNCTVRGPVGSTCLEKQVCNLNVYDSILSAQGSNAILNDLDSGGVTASVRVFRFCVLQAPTLGFTPDSANIQADPQFANAAAGDLHLKSTAGRWDPLMNGGTGAWVVDAVDSPAIDAGDLEAFVGDETSPNGGRLNAGGYGGTSQASRSGATPVRRLVLTSPSTGGTLRGRVDVSWSTDGIGWQGGDLVRLEYSADGGGAWNVIPGGGALAYNAGSFVWDTVGLNPGATYRLRVVTNTDGAVSAAHASNFTLGTATYYYVNDASTVGDRYCSAPGVPGNTGLSPLAPASSIQTILDTNDLEGGDIIFVDAGTYTLASNLTIGSADGGSSTNPVRIVGSPDWGATIIDRNGSSGSYAIYINGASGVSLENLWVTRGGTGIYVTGSNCQVSKCRVFKNLSRGIDADLGSSNARVKNCLVDRNGGTGVRVKGGTGIYAWQEAHVEQCTVVGHSQSQVLLTGSTVTVGLQRNIISGGGSFGGECIAIDDTAVRWAGSDYNNLFAQNGVNLGSWYTNGTKATTLSEWRALSGGDSHSMSSEPLFVDPDGADNISGTLDDNYHLQSAGGSWKGGAFAADAATSPCVDVGPASEAVGDESAPNGGRINLGAFGGTALASRTPLARVLAVREPQPNHAVAGQVGVVWGWAGLSWQAGDTVRLEFSLNNGLNWQPVSGAGALPYATGRFEWDSTSVGSSAVAKVRVVCNNDGTEAQMSDSFILHNSPLAYYVNDGVVTGDVYCSAAGLSANDGLSAATPMENVQAVLDRYDLEPGDIVWVDTGTYSIPDGITILDDDNGCTLVGSSNWGGTVLQGSGAAPVIKFSGCSGVALANVWLTGGASGVEFNGARYCSVSTSRIYGNSSQGVWNGSVLTSNYCSLVNCLIDRNGAYGIRVEDSNGMRIVNCTIYGHASSEIYEDLFGFDAAYLTIKNSITAVPGVSASNNYSIQYSNYNDYYRSSGAVQSYGSFIAAGLDRNSFSRDPLFVDPDGPDNIPGNADDDFHLQSAAGSWHGGSFAADAATSPCLDAGAPGDPVGAETMPNGGHIEIGAFGGTSHASRTPSARSLRLLSPNGGDASAGLAEITWESAGSDWQASDTVRLEYSLDGGGTWQVVAGATALPYNSGRFVWDDSALSESPVALVRVVANAGSVQDASDGLIHTGPVSYYVNDASSVGDGGYCSAIGSSLNSGLSPNAPKLSVQEILAAYDLGAGDIIYVESGTYPLSGTLQVGSAHSGSPGAFVRVVGPVAGGVAILARSTTSGPVVQLSGCSYVSLENLFIAGGGTGVDLVNAPNCRLTGCRIFKNTGFGVSVANSSSVTLQNCIVDNNGARGVSSSSANFSMSNCTVFGHSSHEVYLFFEETTSVLRNNLVWSDGSGRIAIYCDSSSPGFSDYNDLLATNGASVGYRSGISRLTLASWQTGTGKDTHSISADPSFVDADGVDNVIGTVDDDLHLQSIAGSWHDGLFTDDAASSPCIDAGDPASSIGMESAPNGGRINIGAYGGTAQASRSFRTIALLSPTEGAVFRLGSLVRWSLSSSGVQPSDTVSLSYSSDAGVTWTPIPEGQAISAASGQLSWNILGLTPGTTYRVRAVVDQAPTVSSEVGNFTIGSNYFVNDSVQQGDVYCSAVGSDSNSGTSPSAPMLTLQALLAAKDLEPGDTVFVDAGNYVLGSSAVIDATDAGNASARVIIQGVPGKTILDRNDTVSSSAACLLISGSYVSVDGLHCTRAYKGISITGSSINVTNSRIDGCSYRSIDGYEAAGCRIQNCLVVQSGGGGAVVMSRQNNSGVLGLTFVNNTVVARGTSAVYLDSRFAPGSTIRNCIFDVIGGVGLKVSSLTVSGQVHDSDYNVFHCGSDDLLGYDGKYVNGEFATLPVWQAVTGRDLHSLVADPYFANPTGGDYHLRSAAGRFDPSQDLKPDNPAAWVVDAVTSPAIDAGDPTLAVAQESDSNGGRVNVGAYGGTIEASRSPAASRHLDLLLSSTTFSGPIDLQWRLLGNGWLATDLLRLEFSSDDGATWQTMSGAAQVRADSLRFYWNTYGVANGYGYRMRAVLVSSSLLVGSPSGYFAIANEGGGAWDLFVAPSGGDDGFHGTPTQPFRSVTYALAVADGKPGGAVNVKVAGGSYPGTIAMKPQVNLMGGYSPLVWSRDLPSQVSILDGEGKGPVVTGADDALIDGFTITGGAASSYGGGISCSGVSPTIRSCRIFGNAATYRGGGIYVANASPVISSCVIASNDAPTGDGIYLEWSAAQVRNCTIVNNGGHGVYLYNANLSPRISNCVLWNNGDDLNNVSASYSDVEDSDFGVGVIHLDPQLDPQFRLCAASPCINRGSNLSGFQMWPDVDGGGRVRFGTIDIGAHEFAGGVDTDADGLEDWFEIRYFGSVSAPLAVPGADGDADGQNNLAEQLANTDPTSSASKSDPSIVDLPSALNAPSLTWSTNGWAGQRLMTHDGDAAAKSGAIADGEESWLETEVEGPCRVSFLWKISSEEGWDYVRLLLDGQLASGVPELTGEVNWSLQSVSIPAGTHTLRWVYSKDEAGAAGADAAWVDEVSLLFDVAITTQPVGQTVDPNASVSFTVAAGGTGPISYQWRKNGSNIVGATSASYTIASAQQSHEGDYSVVVSNAFSSATSDAATLTVNDPVVVTTHPAGQTVNPNASVTFTVTASGTSPLGYQWRKNGGNIGGATSASYTIASAQQADEGGYSVVVSNAFSSATSNTATLTVNDPVVVTTQPSSRAVNPNASTTFTVAVSGTGPLSYQWSKNGSNILGATGASYTIASAQQADEGDYTVMVSNAFSSATSNAATLTVNDPVVVTTHPVSQAVNLNATVTFTVTASGTGPLGYQWRKNGGNIGGATSASFTIASAQASDQAGYSVVVSNAFSSVTSNTANLTVQAAGTITQQPVSQTVNPGANATLTVVAVSNGSAFSYQWRKNGSDLLGANSASLTINAVQEGNEGSYAVLLTNNLGSILSNPASLTVNDPVVLTTQPVGQTVNPNASVNFTVAASGTGPFNYQWRKNGSDVAGATSTTHTIGSAQQSDEGDYSVVVSNGFSSATSNSAALMVNDPVVITAQPQPALVTAGSSVTFIVSATGTAPLGYQWRKDGNLLVGANDPVLNLSGVQMADAGAYDVVVDNIVGSVTSSAASLQIGTEPPAIVAQPQDATAEITAPVEFSVLASGAGPLSYQWSHNGVPLPGGTNSTLVLAAAGISDFGGYSVIVSNANGSVTSNTAVLRLTNVPTYTFSTIAGSMGKSGDVDGTGSAARFSSPKQMVMEGSSNLLVADYGNGQIRRVSVSGSVTGLGFLFYTGPGSGLRIYQPEGVAVNASGQIFSTDYWPFVRRNTFGTVINLAGGVGLGYGQSGHRDGVGNDALFSAPRGLAVDAQGNVIVADSLNAVIRKITPSAEVSTIAGVANQSGVDGARLHTPAAVAVDSLGRVLIADQGAHNIRRLLADGTLERLAGGAGDAGSADGIGGEARFNSPAAIAVDAAHNVFVADMASHTIRRIGAGGLTNTIGGLAGIPGGTNGLGKAARFNSPQGIAVTDDGTVYVADTGNQIIRKGAPLYAPLVNQSPQHRLVALGGPFSLEPVVTGSDPMTWTWKKGGVAVPGANGPVYGVAASKLSHAGSYTAVIKNAAGSVATVACDVGVVSGATSTVTVNVSATLNLTLASAGSGLIYEWRRDGVTLINGGRIKGADKSKLSVGTMSAGDAGVYTCLVRMGSVSMESGPFHVQVLEKPVLDPFVPGDWIVSGSVSKFVSAQNSPSRFTISGLPSGMTYNRTTGEIIGKPNVAGSFVIRITASNAAGSSAVQVVTIVVAALPAQSVGTFDGLIGREVLNSGLGGKIRIVTTARGSFSGRLTLGRKVYSFVGRLDSSLPFDSTSVVSIKRRGMEPLVVSLGIDGSTGKLTGSLADGGDPGSLSFSALRTVWHSVRNPAQSRQGRHVIGLDLDSAWVGQVGMPQGSGFVVIVVGKSGSLTVSGRLADGTLLLGGAPLGPLGEVRIFSPLYSTTGSVLWSLQIADDAGHSCLGSLDWMKGPSSTTTTRLYKAGFGPISLVAVGSLYEPPVVGQIVLGMPPGPENASLLFAEGGIADSSINPNILMEISDRNTPKLPPAGSAANLAKLTFKLYTSTGLFQGTFRLVDTPPGASKAITRDVTYRGMLVPVPDGPDKGLGYFLLPKLPDATAVPSTTTTTSPILSGKVLLQQAGP